jgi:hypothetical protein
MTTTTSNDKTRNDQQKTTTNDRTKTKTTGTGRNPWGFIRGFSKFLFTMGLGAMMLLNCQPWLELAAQIAGQIRIVPFLDSLIAIPYLGGWIQWLAVNGAKILGLLLWFSVQLIEIIPMVAKDPQIVAMWVERWDGKEFRVRGDGSSSDQLKTIFNQFPTEWFASLAQYRAAAYAIEFLVCFLRFPPYEGGVEAIASDFPNFDPSLILWWQLALFLLTMFGFEICLRLILRLWQGIRYLR